MKFDKASIIQFRVTVVAVAVGVVIANNLIQPRINSMKVSAPATA